MHATWTEIHENKLSVLKQKSLKTWNTKALGFFLREYPSRPSGDLPFEIFFPGISALIDSQESQITKENRGVWQATDAHADSDPKILGLHVQCP